jgi:hypothetical protein
MKDRESPALPAQPKEGPLTEVPACAGEAENCAFRASDHQGAWVLPIEPFECVEDAQLAAWHQPEDYPAAALAPVAGGPKDVPCRIDGERGLRGSPILSPSEVVKHCEFTSVRTDPEKGPFPVLSARCGYAVEEAIPALDQGSDGKRPVTEAERVQDYRFPGGAQTDQGAPFASENSRSFGPRWNVSRGEIWGGPVLWVALKFESRIGKFLLGFG